MFSQRNGKLLICIVSFIAHNTIIECSSTRQEQNNNIVELFKKFDGQYHAHMANYDPYQKDGKTPKNIQDVSRNINTVTDLVQNSYKKLQDYRITALLQQPDIPFRIMDAYVTSFLGNMSYLLRRLYYYTTHLPTTVTNNELNSYIKAVHRLITLFQQIRTLFEAVDTKNIATPQYVLRSDIAQNIRTLKELLGAIPSTIVPQAQLNEELYEAVKVGNITKMEQLIQQGADPNGKPLKAAVEYVLQHIDVIIKDKNVKEVLLILLGSPKLLINQKDADGKTILKYFIDYCLTLPEKISVWKVKLPLKRLLEYGASPLIAFGSLDNIENERKKNKNNKLIDSILTNILENWLYMSADDQQFYLEIIEKLDYEVFKEFKDCLSSFPITTLCLKYLPDPILPRGDMQGIVLSNKKFPIMRISIKTRNLLPFDEIQFLVAHEIAHYKLGHYEERLVRRPSLHAKDEEKLKAVKTIFERTFGRQQEYEADELAVKMTGNIDGGIKFLKSILALGMPKWQQAKKEWLTNTHPYAEDLIAHLERLKEIEEIKKNPTYKSKINQQQAKKEKIK